jgi:hypothetical protein
VQTAIRLLLGLLLVGACSREVPADDAPTPTPAPETAPKAEPTDEARFEEFTVRSDQLSTFWNEDIEIRSMVVLPPGLGRDPNEEVPVVFYVHGFGGNHRMAGARFWNELERGFTDGTTPRMLYVFLDASFRTGHHVFADSANNGPWGAALTQEFVPALEKRYPVVDAPYGRFLTGHSSGGWSTLWLQVAYPDFFGGTWPTAPDPVDFRNFTGIDLYAWDDAYRDPQGEVIQLWRKGDGWRYSFEEFARKEAAEQPVGGQLYSFDAVFSPRREDGTPAPMFDRETGKIDHAVVEAWKPYDISLVLRENWAELGPKLAGKLHVIVGTKDTFRLNESCRLLDAELERLGSPDRVLFVEGRTHGDLSQPHSEHYPDGLYQRIFGEMWASYQQARSPALREAG